MSGTVIVLTPTGRRQPVKVTPNTTLLQVLEEACQKHGFKAELYNIIHHRKVLDVSLTIRFSGLPNNCILEMVEADVPRQELSVTIGVQTEDGNRVLGEFNPIVTVEQVLQKLCPQEIKADTVVIYMRNELYGEELRKKTLKAMGITSGRAMLRLMHRNPEALKVQANVSAPLPSKPMEEKPYKRQFQPLLGEEKQEIIKPNQQIPQQLSTEEPRTPHSSNYSNYNFDANRDQPEAKRKQPFLKDDNIFDKLRNEKRKQTEGLKIKSQPQQFKTESSQQVIEREISKDDFIFLGERNAMLFSFETAQAVNTEELPDDFFELSITDVKKLFRDIKQRRLDLEGGPLMTKAMRELQETKEQLQALNHYKKAVIRIKFPDQLVLQGVFKPRETIQDVIEFVREYIADEKCRFYLFTTPPKTILEPKLNLLEAGCVPGALLHFGCDDKKKTYLRPDILDKVVSNTSAASAASQARRENVRVSHAHESDIDISEFLKAEYNSTPTTSSNSVDYESRTTQPKTEKLPKWFKPSK